MATVIDMTSASSNLQAYLDSWSSAFVASYGDFNPGYNPSNSSQVYTQWGAGSSGGNGIYMDGEMQYTQGNLTGTIDAVYLGTGFSTSGGFSLGTVGLTITPDNSDPTSAFDYAIYDLSVNDSLSGLYAYFASTGTVINGTSASDIITGFAGADTINAGDGGDTVSGGTGNDVLNGGAGTDLLSGGADNDVLNGGIGNDYLNGGAGADTFAFDDNWGTDTVTDFTDGVDFIQFNGLWTDWADFSSDSNVTIGSNSIAWVDGSDTWTITLSGFSGTLNSSDFLFA